MALCWGQTQVKGQGLGFGPQDSDVQGRKRLEVRDLDQRLCTPLAGAPSGGSSTPCAPRGVGRALPSGGS